MIRKLIAGAAAAAVLGAGALAYAADDPARPTLLAQAEAPQDEAGDGAHPDGLRPRLRHRMEHRREMRHHALGRVAHGDLIVADGEDGWETVSFDNGTVAAVGADSITIDRPDGVTVELAIDDATAFKGVAGWEEIRTGDRAHVRSEAGTAKVIVQRPEGWEPPAQHADGQVS